MQYTFLPQQEQVRALRDYRTRVLIVGLFFVAIGVMVGACALFPAYIYALLEKGVHVNQVASLRSTDDARRLTQVQQELAQSNVVLQAVADTTRPSRSVDAIRAISKLRGPVSIDSFALETIQTGGRIVTISGVAPVRTDLLSFKNKLIQQIPGSEVDLPYAILARDTKVPYSMRITIHEAQP